MSIHNQFSGISKQNKLLNLDFISKQMQFLFDIIIVTIDIKINRLKNELREFLQIAQSLTVNVQSQSQNFRIDLQLSKVLIGEKIKFFNFTTNNSKLIISLKKHVFYKNIYAFVNRSKNVVNIKSENKIKIIVSQCLRNTALI